MIKLSKEDMQRLLLTVSIYEESIFVTKRDESGVQKSFEVAAEDLVKRLSFKTRFSTGLLKPGTLFYSSDGSQEKAMIYLEPCVREMKISRAVLRVPMPPMVLWGAKNTYGIAALKGPAVNRSAMIYAAPLPNVNDNGEICQGNVRFPGCSAENIRAAEKLFWESGFNKDLTEGKCRSSRENVIELIKKLQHRARFPEKELVRSSELPDTLGDLVKKLSDDYMEE